MARVGAIGHVHRQLYSANDVRSIDLGSYLENLMSDLRQAVGQTASGAELVVKAEPRQHHPPIGRSRSVRW